MTARPPRLRTIDNALWRACAGYGAKLSILVPFRGHDPSGLVRALATSPAAGWVELVLLDDGGADAHLANEVVIALEAFGAPGRLIVRETNGGRAAARNTLLSHARGRHVLFLDADMRPASQDFLPDWLSLVLEHDPAVAFGGFEVAARADTPEAHLHAFMARRSDCKPAKVRRKCPAQHLATSNLLVRADVMAAFPFDAAFAGWGYEDTDWALRVSKTHPILHIDNPALHLGLDPPETLLRKFREGGANYARLAAKHPEAVQGFSGYRAAKALKGLGISARLRPFLEWLVQDEMGVAPLGVRNAALKLYRAAQVAEHLP